MEIPFDEMAEVAGELEVEQEKAAQLVTGDSDFKLVVDRFIEVERKVDEFEKVLKGWKEERDRLRKDVLPDAMRKAGIAVNNRGSFTTDSGTIYLETREYISVNKQNADAFEAWLRSTYPQEADLLFKRAIDSGSLKGLVETLREEHVEIPEVITIHEETVAKIRGLRTRAKKQ